MNSLNQINRALGTRLSQKTFNAWAHALCARIESLRWARKKQKISHEASKSFSSIRHICKVFPRRAKKRIKGCNLANALLASYEEGDACFTPKTTAVDSTEDGLGGIVDHLQRLIRETPPDAIDGQELRDTQEHNGFSQCGGSDTAAIAEEEQQMYFDPNEPPSAAVPTELRGTVETTPRSEPPYPQGRQIAGQQAHLIAGEPEAIQEECQDENLLLSSPPASGINHQPSSSAGLGSQPNVQGDGESCYRYTTP